MFLHTDWRRSEADGIHLQSKKANFDSTHELEELLLEDNPLKARKRKANQDLGALSAEMRQMEEQCVSPHDVPIFILDDCPSIFVYV